MDASLVACLDMIMCEFQSCWFLKPSLLIQSNLTKHEMVSRVFDVSLITTIVKVTAMVRVNRYYHG